MEVTNHLLIGMILQVGFHPPKLTQKLTLGEFGHLVKKFQA